MRKRRLLSCTLRAFMSLLLTFSVIQAFADDAIYDELYNRPTYFPDWKQPSEWPVTMSYFTCARMGKNGDRLYNYEVAVYDQNNKLRHCGRSIAWQRNLCTLTIPGGYGDVFHFKVIYGDFVNPTIVDVPETCSFVANDNIGGLLKPFWLTIPVASKLDFWTGDDTGAASGTIAGKDVTAGTVSSLANVTHVKISGDWSEQSISGLFKDCKNLQYVEFLDMPKTTAGAFEGANPNCLKFIPEDATVPDGWSNVIVGTKAATDIVLYEGTADDVHPFHNPTAFSLDGHKAIYTCPSSKWADGKSGWQTIILPFDAVLQADGVTIAPYQYNTRLCERYINKGILGYWLLKVDDATNTDGVSTSFVYVDNKLEANKPYLFALPGKHFTMTNNKTISLENKDLKFVSSSDEFPATPSTQTNTGEDELTEYPFRGTYVSRTNTSMYLLESSVTSAGLDAFVKTTEGSIYPFHACLEMGSTSGANYLAVNIKPGDDDITTGITSTDAMQQSVPVIYTVSGMRVKQMDASGIYIINAKKIIK